MGTAPRKLGTGQTPYGLSVRLREGTRRAHRWVERLAFVRGFLRGLIDLESYRRLLIDFHAVYEALEESLCAQQTEPVIEPLILPQLWRQESLAQDLDYLDQRLGIQQSWRLASPSLAALRYAARLRTHAQKCPELLIAHAYTRYLGDLSGGQILRRIAAYALRLEGPAGLSFYEFSQIPNIEEFKHQFRQRLDELPLAESMLSAVIAEAVQAFTYSGAIFEAQRQLPAATEPPFPALLVPP